MNNHKYKSDTQSHEYSRAQKHQQIQNALAPFEEDLIAQLPTPEQIIEAALARQKKNRQRFKKILSIAVVSGAGGLFYLDPAYDQQILTTVTGQYKDVILKDGSQLQLNTDTVLNVSYHLRSRRIYLQQGEATFHVKHGVMPYMERSFNVWIDDIRVQDIGTVFNVRKFSGNDIQVSVLEGEVRIHTLQQRPINVLAGQSMSTQQGQYLPVSNTVDVEQIVAWQKGYFYFNDKPLAEVLDELQRYGQMPIHIQNEHIAQLRISGQVDLNHRMQFVHALATFAPVRVIQQSNGDVMIQEK